MSDNIVSVNQDNLKDKIYSIRGVQVIFDRDLAILYDVKPIRLREQVKRNNKRFPSKFMFQLTEAEVDFMVSQNAIPSKQYLGGSLPYAFTEQGGGYKLTQFLNEYKFVIFFMCENLRVERFV